MNILLTGGAGYIGSATAQTLIQAGHSVTIIDSLEKGHRAAVPSGAEFIHADLADPHILQTTFTSQAFDAILHFAAFIEAGESMKEPARFFKNNFVNSLQLIEVAVQAGVRKFVLSSTAGIYASSDQPLTEQASLGPTSVYGQTKLMVEQTLEWYRQIYNLRFAALRYFNAAGALPGHGEDHHPESHLIPLVLKVALSQRDSIQIFGTDYLTPDGTCIRDYIHIADLISAHLLALEALDTHDRLIYNLGNGTGYSVLQVIETARQVTGHPIPAFEAPRRPGDAARLVASSDRIQQDLGWKPDIPNLRDIIASAWEWHHTHPHGYQSKSE